MSGPCFDDDLRQLDAFAGADLECVDTTGLMSVPGIAPIGCPTRRSIRPVTRSGRLPNDAWAMTDPVTLTIPADRLRWSDLGGLFQRGVVVSIPGPRSVADFLAVDLAIDPDYVRRTIATVFVDSMVVDDLDRAMLHPGSTLTLSAAMPGLVGATLRRSSYYSAMRAEVSWRECHLDGRDDESAPTIRVKLFNLIIPGVGPSILRRGIVLAHDEAARILGPDPDLQRIAVDREILLRVAA